MPSRLLVLLSVFAVGTESRADLVSRTVPWRPNSPERDAFLGWVVLSLILVPYLSLAGLAPEYVYETDADHPRLTMHRHLQPHSAASHDSDHAQLADDEHVVGLI